LLVTKERLRQVSRDRRFFALVTFLAVLAAGYDIPRVVSDSEYYQNLAEGKASLVPAPFSQRILFPALARTLHAFGLSFRAAFVLVAVVALAGFLAATVYLLKDVAPLAIPLLLLTPFVILTFREAYLPDLTFAAMLAGFLVLIRRFPRWWTPLALIPMFATRESTLLVAAVLAVLAWRRRQRAMVATTVAATAVGLVIEEVAAQAGRPTLFHVGGITYLAAKLPYNFMKNIVGVPPWTNHVSGASTNCTPTVTWRLPHLLHAGSIHAVGLCTFTAGYPLTTLATWLTLFGIAPTVLMLLVSRHETHRPLWLQLALWYGVLAFVGAPLLGSSVRRLIGYGWPAMIVGAAVLLSVSVGHQRLLWLLALSFGVCWLPAIISLFAVGTLASAIVILLAVPAHIVAARLLRRTTRARGYLEAGPKVPPPSGLVQMPAEIAPAGNG
jgi:hypothetical protein